VIRLAPGDYGDIAINTKALSGAGLTIMSADVNHPASFNTLNIFRSSGIHFDNVDVDYTATKSTYSFDSVVAINGSHGITFTGGEVTATSAVNGVAADSDVLDSSGNVIGLQTGRGFTIARSSGVTVQGVDIHHVAKGVELSN
jgi:hypothetical protein